MKLLYLITLNLFVCSAMLFSKEHNSGYDKKGKGGDFKKWKEYKRKQQEVIVKNPDVAMNDDKRDDVRETHEETYQ